MTYLWAAACSYQPTTAGLWRVSWSVSGGILAVSDGNNNVTLWKEQMDSKWQKLS